MRCMAPGPPADSKSLVARIWTPFAGIARVARPPGAVAQPTVDSHGLCVHTGEETCVLAVRDQSHPPFEGFSERVTDGTDQERTVAYSRWLKRLRDNQDNPQDSVAREGDSAERASR